jgi:spore germination protein YaaH
MRNQPLAVVVPPGDTVSYPTEIIARVADVLVVRLHPEHRQGTAPGPLTSPEMIAREIGHRAKLIGANRLMAELPLFGYRWNADGTAGPITYAEAQSLVIAEAGEFRRDQASQFLVASGRNGWTVWVPDARTIEFMIRAALRSGVREITLAGPVGSDLSIPDRVKALVRR